MSTFANKQLLAVQKGGPFEIFDHTTQPPKDNEVLIETKAIAFNPVDNKKLDYGVTDPSWPALFGLDAAGIVRAVGSEVKNFKPGDEVLGLFVSGCFQIYSATEAINFAHKPTSMTFEEAATLPVAFMTACEAVYGCLGLPFPGTSTTGFQPTSVLVLGSSSIVGASALQLLRHSLPNAKILTTSSSKHHERNKILGASNSFDQKDSNLVEKIRAATNGRGVDAILDAVSGVGSNKSLLEAFDPNGPKAFTDVFTGSNVDSVPEGINYKVVLGTNVLGRPYGNDVMPLIEKLFAEGIFKLPVGVKITGKGLKDIPKSLDELKAGVSGTKLVISI